MLDHINLKQKLSKAEYKERLPALQRRLYDLERAVFQARVPVMVVFEGWAAAGKGSTINALAERLDPRGLRVVPITPPRTAELRYPWMRRFWLQIAARGQIVVYDTSWYRRVLIERVTGAVRKREWRRGYQDILEFEEQLAADGTVIVKFWLHISKKEQGKRFKKLRADKLTAWQVSEEDDAQHKAYKKYRRAVEEMLARTEAGHAPWTVVEATDRRYTLIKVLETLVRALEARVGAAAPGAAEPGAESTPASVPMPVAAVEAAPEAAKEDGHA
jgi:polyphosphate kinase 2 (PPK2 family)